MRQISLIALILLIACESPEDKAEKAREELVSWSATGEILAHQWSRESTPTPYVKSTLNVATNTLAKLAKPLESDRESKETLSRVTQLYDSFSRAVERNDREGAAKSSRQFAAINRAPQRR